MSETTTDPGLPDDVGVDAGADPTGTAPAPAALEESMPHPSDPSVTPFLMFEGDAGAAMDAYLSVFVEHLPVTEVRRDLFDDSSPRGADWASKVLHGELEVAGQRLRFFDSFTSHGFTFTPAISLFVELPDPTAVDAVHDALIAGGGQDYMPPGDYGFSRRFAWVGDRFGVTWQLNAA